MESVVLKISDANVDLMEVVAEIRASSYEVQEQCFGHLALMLIDGTPEQRRRAAEVASQLTMPVQYVAVLAKSLSDDDDHVRFGAAWALVHLGEKAEGALPELLKRFEDESLPVRDRAGWAVSNIGAPALTSLLDGMKNALLKTRGISIHCISAIIKIPPDRKNALPDAEAKALAPLMLDGMNDPEPSVRFCALEALDSLNKRFVIPAMVELMASNEDGIREQAALRLSWASPRLTPEAMAALKAAMQDSSSSVRFFAASALHKMGRKDDGNSSNAG